MIKKAKGEVSQFTLTSNIISQETVCPRGMGGDRQEGGEGHTGNKTFSVFWEPHGTTSTVGAPGHICSPWKESARRPAPVAGGGFPHRGPWAQKGSDSEGT